MRFYEYQVQPIKINQPKMAGQFNNTNGHDTEYIYIL